MERKNTILLTVIAVATLLVAVVGATFAYFTATTTQSGAGETATGSTADLKGATLTLAPSGNIKSFFKYPGGYGVAGASFAAAKKDSADTNAYNVSYKVTYSIANATNTELTFKIYKSGSAITDNGSCTDNVVTNGAGQNYSLTCTGRADFSGATVVAEGTVAGGATVTDASAGLTKQVALETVETGTTSYYYLVVEYPNSDSVDQISDMGKTITASITGASGLSSVVKTS